MIEVDARNFLLETAIFDNKINLLSISVLVYANCILDFGEILNYR